MDSNTLFRWFMIIVVSAIVHSLILYFVIGMPTPGLFSRGVDLEATQMPPTQQPATPPTALKDSDVPAPMVAPAQPAVAQTKKTVHRTKAAVKKTPEVPTEQATTTPAPQEHKVVVDVKFEKDPNKDQSNDDASDDKTAEKEDSAPQTQPHGMIPEKVAGVQSQSADDKSEAESATEAGSPEANPAAPSETEPATTVIDKTTTPQDN